MRILLLIAVSFLAFNFLFTSCEKDQELLSNDALIQEIALSEVRQSIEPDQLPGSIITYVDENHFDTFIEEAFTVSGRGYELLMGSEERMFFDRNGDVLEFRGHHDGLLGTDGPHGPCHRPGLGFGRPVFIDELPESIINYVSESFPDNEIRKAKARHGNFFVLVNVPIVLKFDGEGNFIEELSPLHRCHRPCHPVRFGNLPEVIQDHVAENYTDAEFRRACVRRGRVIVLLLDQDGRIILIFDHEGNLLHVRG